MENRQQNRKRTGLLAALALCCILAVGGGVMAWFSAKGEVNNVFTSGGGITDPEKEPDKNDPEKPGVEENTDGKVEEDKWEPNSPITPGSSVPKNPNVGIGSTSASAYVFVEVENNVGDGTYFILNDNWMPVDVDAAKYDGAEGWVAVHENAQDVQNKAYSSGLFVYKKGAQEGTLPAAMMQLQPNSYTGEVFSKVFAGPSAVIADDGNVTMDVKAYLAAASSDTEDVTSDAAKNEILAAAKAWAKTN